LKRQNITARHIIFAARGCKDRFKKDPEKYIRGEKKDWIKE